MQQKYLYYSKCNCAEPKEVSVHMQQSKRKYYYYHHVEKLLLLIIVNVRKTGDSIILVSPL